MNRKNLKGLWIPAGILLNEDLSDKEKIILSMILYLSEERKSCFASNKKYIPYRSDRNYDNFDWDRLYAN